MRGARPQRAIEQHVRSDGVLQHGDRVVVACSGGPDSVALAAVLVAVARPLALRLSLAHVNHGGRASAWQDECVVMRVAASLRLPLDAVALCLTGKSEAAMRESRYAALVSVARARDANVVATAHNAEDQSETVLLALFRGTGPHGLAGIPPRRRLEEGIALARPLLRIGAEDLRYYSHVNALPYAVDPTNGRRALRRNAVRAALGDLRPAFPGLDLAVARAAELVASEQAGSLRADLRRRVRREVAEQAGLRDIDFAHVEAAVRAMESGRGGRFLMKKGVALRVEAGKRKDR